MTAAGNQQAAILDIADTIEGNTTPRMVTGVTNGNEDLE